MSQPTANPPRKSSLGGMTMEDDQRELMSLTLQIAKKIGWKVDQFENGRWSVTDPNEDAQALNTAASEDEAWQEALQFGFIPTYPAKSEEIFKLLPYIIGISFAPTADGQRVTLAEFHPNDNPSATLFGVISNWWEGEGKTRGRALATAYLSYLESVKTP